jgi:hypothetical protein
MAVRTCAALLDELHDCALDDDLVWEFAKKRGISQRTSEELEQNKEGSVPEARVPGTDLCDLCPNPETKDLCGDCPFNDHNSHPLAGELIRENYNEDMGKREIQRLENAEDEVIYGMEPRPAEICKDLPINEDLPHLEDEPPFDDMHGGTEGLV